MVFPCCTCQLLDPHRALWEPRWVQGWCSSNPEIKHSFSVLVKSPIDPQPLFARPAAQPASIKEHCKQSLGQAGLCSLCQEHSASYSSSLAPQLIPAGTVPLWPKGSSCPAIEEGLSAPQELGLALNLHKDSVWNWDIMDTLLSLLCFTSLVKFLAWTGL